MAPFNSCINGIILLLSCPRRRTTIKLLELIMEEKNYVVYILSSRKYGTLYIGITSNIIQRMYQHKNDLVKGFTKKYAVHNLVYYEIH